MSTSLRHHGENGLVVFCGAGVSMVPPTCLPSWWEMNEQVILALAEQVEDFCGAERAAEIARLINERRNNRRFPPEYQAEIITEHFGSNYFRVLQCLDGDEPNPAHLAIAELARSGLIRAVITSNFDRLLEVAFRQRDVPLEVHYRTDDFDRLANSLDALSDSSSCHLIKLHGSVDDHTTLVDTLAQRMRGLPPAIHKCVRHLLRNHHWLFLGYSGSDLESDSQYMGIAAEAGDAVGFSWLVRDSSKSEPIQAVKDLCARYAERASAPRGELPHWLYEQFGHVLQGKLQPSSGWSDEDLAGRKADASAAVVDHTRSWGADVGGIRAAMALANMLSNVVSEPAAARDLLQSALEKRGDDDKAFAAIGNSLANVLSASGHLKEAAALAEQVIERIGHDDEARRARVLSTLGLIESKAGNYRQALGRFEEAHDAFAAVDDEKSRSVALHNRAMTLAALGNHGEAQTSYEDELEIVRELGDTVAEAETLNNLGELLIRMDRYDEAIEMQRESIELRERLGDDRGVAYSLGNIATAYQRRGDLTRAIDAYEEVLVVFRRIGDRTGEVTTLLNKGKAAQDQGRTVEARSTYREAIAIASETGLEPHRARGLWLMGTVLSQTKKIQEARQLYDEALDIYQRSGDVAGQADVLNEIGIQYWENGDLEQAEAHFKLAIEHHEDLNQPVTRTALITNLALVLRDRGKLDNALEVFQQKLTLSEQIGSTPGTANVLYNIGALHLQKGDEASAVESLDKAQQLFLEMNASNRVVEIRSIIGEILGSQGKIGLSFQWFDGAIELASTDDERSMIAQRLGNILGLLLETGHHDLAQACIDRMRACGATVQIARDGD